MSDHPETRSAPAILTRAQRFWRLNPDHVRRRDRATFPVFDPPDLLGKALGAVWPWTVADYPGRNRLLGWLLGDVDPETAARYRRKVPRSRVAIVVGRLRLIARRLDACADALAATLPPNPNSNSDSEKPGAR